MALFSYQDISQANFLPGWALSETTQVECNLFRGALANPIGTLKRHLERVVGYTRNAKASGERVSGTGVRQKREDLGFHKSRLCWKKQIHHTAKDLCSSSLTVRL